MVSGKAASCHGGEHRLNGAPAIVVGHTDNHHADHPSPHSWLYKEATIQLVQELPETTAAHVTIVIITQAQAVP